MTTTAAKAAGETADAKPAYRAGYRNARHYFDTIEEAATHARDNGGPLDRLAGQLYRTLPGTEQAEAIAAIKPTS